MKNLTTTSEIRETLIKDNKATYRNYLISFFSSNKENLRFQVSDNFMTLEFSDNLTDCITYIDERIEKFGEYNPNI